LTRTTIVGGTGVTASGQAVMSEIPETAGVHAAASDGQEPVVV